MDTEMSELGYYQSKADPSVIINMQMAILLSQVPTVSNKTI